MKVTEKPGVIFTDPPAMVLKHKYIGFLQQHAVELGKLAEEALEEINRSNNPTERTLLSEWYLEISSKAFDANSDAIEATERSPFAQLHAVEG